MFINKTQVIELSNEQFSFFMFVFQLIPELQAQDVVDDIVLISILNQIVLIYNSDFFYYGI